MWEKKSPKRSWYQRRSGSSSDGMRLAPPAARDHHVLALHVHVVDFQRARRRPADVAALQVVDAVVAGAPDVVLAPAVLHGAFEVGAGGAEGAIVAGRRAHQDARAAAEAEDFAAVGRELVGPPPPPPGGVPPPRPGGAGGG